MHASVNRQMLNDPRNIVGKTEELRLLREEMRDLAAQIVRRVSHSLANWMQIKPAQLDTHLAQHLAPCYLISGDELLLVQECADAHAAQHAPGAAPKDSASTFWKGRLAGLGHAAGSLSLFAERKLIEVQLPSGKPSTEGSKAIQECLASSPRRCSAHCQRTNRQAVAW